jgi:hypothetical protein
MRQFRRYFYVIRVGSVLVFMVVLLAMQKVGIQAAPVLGVITLPAIEDQTPLEPLLSPDALTYSSRYISGFGLDDSFTVFFEDRDNGSRISYVSSDEGPTAFPSTVTATNIVDTHLLVKDWPYFYDGTLYGYRAWGAVGNNPEHHFYVSDDLVSWTLVSTFTIPNAASFTTTRGFVYYGFHDIILINGTYYGWGEANSGETMFVRSAMGGDDWEAFTKVGGNQLEDGPLVTPAEGISPTPTGSFFELADNQGYGKLYVPGDDSGIYLAVNTVAKPSQEPAVLEANFIDPANWTWHEGSTGRLTSLHALLYGTSYHDYREVWMVPQPAPHEPWVILYTASFDGNKALGYATSPNVCDPGKACMIFPIAVK